MQNFKAWDKVQENGRVCHGTFKKYIGDLEAEILWECPCHFSEYLGISLTKLSLISSTNQPTMNIKEKFLLAFKSEPEKSFRKAGITNGDDFLTDDGQQIFLGWLLQKHGDEFKKEVVDDLLKDQEDAN